MMASLPPPETWTNSWTGWISETSNLEERDQTLDWDLTPTSTTTSNISLRLDQNTSGQFNNGFMDLTKDLMDKEPILFEDMGLPQILDVDMPAHADMSEDDFLNSFMDLSEFLMPAQPTEEIEEVKNVIHLEGEVADENLALLSMLVDATEQEAAIQEEVVSPVKSGKRKVDDVTMTIDDTDWSLTTDHDYVTKKPHLSETIVVDSTKKTPKSTQSTSKSSSLKATPDQKYRERRVKNNIASRRSREIRKMKFSDMEQEANRLEVANGELRVRIEEMEKLAKDMKALLVQKLSTK